MNDRRPMLDSDSRARLGRKLSSDYNLMPDPMLPDRLKELVARLLEGPGPIAPQAQANAGKAETSWRSPAEITEMAEAVSAYRRPKPVPHRGLEAKRWA